MMTSLSTEYYQLLLAQGVLGGMAYGMIFTPAVSCVGQYFTTLRAWAMGVVVAGAAIGGIIFPIMLQKLQPRIGFGWAVRVVGFVLLALLIYASVMTREFAPRRRQGFFVPGAWKNGPYVLANMAFFISLFGTYTPMFYIIDYCLYRGIDPQLAYYQVAIYNAVGCFGRILPNFAGDKPGRFNMSIACYMSCAILCFCWTTTTDVPGITLWNAFYGFFSGAIFSLYSPTIAQGRSIPFAII